jgi:sugar phosphate isomerase/epimerase
VTTAAPDTRARHLPLAGSTFGYLQHRSLSEALDDLAAHGMTQIELTPMPPHLHPPALGAYDRRALRRRLDRLGLRCLSVNPGFVDINLISTNPDFRELSLRQIEAGIELAHDLEARFHVVVPGRRHALSPAPAQDARAVLLDGLERLLRTAEPAGVVLALENSPYGFVGRADDLVRISDELVGIPDPGVGISHGLVGNSNQLVGGEDDTVGTPDEPVGTPDYRVGTCDEPVGRPDEPVGTTGDPSGSRAGPPLRLCYDVANALAQEDPAAGVRRIGPRLGLAHVSDTPRPPWRHTSPGRGEVDFAAFATALSEIGYAEATVYERVDEEDPGGATRGGPRRAARARLRGYGVTGDGERPDLPEAVDVLIAGSGAAGLVAALAAAQQGARVLVAERADAFGGTTALSGGRVWAPGNAHAAVAGRPDSAVAAATYLRAVCPTAPDAHVDVFVGTAPALVQWIERRTPHRFVLCPRYPDYHPTLPGATTGGRTLDSKPFDASEAPGPVLRGPGSVPVTHAEWERWRFVHRYDQDLLAEREAAGIVTGGRALVAALLQACADAGVALVRGARLIALQSTPDGGVTGGEIAFASPAAEDPPPDPPSVAIRCNAVILATGGFDWSDGLRARHLDVPVRAFGSPPTNGGDAVALASGAGAALDGMSNGWMMPMVQVPGEELGGRPFYRSLVTERGIPRSILVNAAGARFVNEALPYNELVRAFQRADAAAGSRTPARGRSSTRASTGATRCSPCALTRPCRTGSRGAGASRTSLRRRASTRPASSAP